MSNSLQRPVITLLTSKPEEVCGSNNGPLVDPIVQASNQTREPHQR